MNAQFWKGKKVLITGHTGFKGSWAALWLSHIGVEVYGLSLEAQGEPSMFDFLNIKSYCKEHIIADIRKIRLVKENISRIKPDIILHMAAQAIVHTGYKKPYETFQTNVMGTIHVLEAIREILTPMLCLVITSDKCYHNKENGWPIRENESIGGNDPYSASKGATELAVNAWKKSFFSEESNTLVLSARAGNVIGGGDWSPSRLIPDAVRSFSNKEDFVVRNPRARRPWQHVLDPLHGYFMLIEAMATRRKDLISLNFGPIPAQDVSVQEIADTLVELWKDGSNWRLASKKQTWKESTDLLLDSQSAYRLLGWKPRLSWKEAIKWSVEWYKGYYTTYDSSYMRNLTISQIKKYSERI